ncbi:hypothetical protein GEMRC1_000377 [Eukaryota sp. GEM-RC1]
MFRGDLPRVKRSYEFRCLSVAISLHNLPNDQFSKQKFDEFFKFHRLQDVPLHLSRRNNESTREFLADIYFEMFPPINAPTWFPNSSMPLSMISRYVMLFLSFIKAKDIESARSVLFVLLFNSIQSFLRSLFNWSNAFNF